MIIIKVLIWKRYAEVKNSVRKWLFLLAPIFCFVFFLMTDVSPYKIFLYFCPVATYVNFLSVWNYENIVYSGYMLVTPINSRKSWINNAIITTMSGYIYSYFVLIIGILIKSLFTYNFCLDPKLLLLGFLNLPFAFSLILSNTVCNVDYSPFKQSIQILFIVVGMGFIGLALFFNLKFFDNGLLSTILAVVITTICLLINMKNNNECLFINTLKVIDEMGGTIED